MDDARHRVVCAALVRGDEVLLVHRRPDRRYFPDVWDLPGGHVEPGEEPAAALVRELTEELGVTVDALPVEPTVQIRPSAELDLSAWAVTDWHGDPRNLAPDEHDDLCWFGVDTLARTVLPGPWDAHTVRLLVALAGMSPARRAALAQVAERVPAGPVRVGIDGVDGAGKTRFADDLAVVLRERARPVVRISVDDFHRPRALRHRRGERDPEGFFLDSFDYDALHAAVLDPFAPGGERRYRRAVHDLATDAPVDAGLEAAAPEAVLVLDGLFLQRDELAGAFDLVVYLDVPFAVTAKRMAVRDGTPVDPADPGMRRYVGGQQLYLARCRPRERADVVVEHSDPLAPVVTRGANRPAAQRDGLPS